MCVQVDPVPGGSGELVIRCLSKDQVHQVLHVDQVPHVDQVRQVLHVDQLSHVDQVDQLDQVDQVPTISEQSPRGERPKVEAVPLPLSLEASRCYVKVKET